MTTQPSVKWQVGRIECEKQDDVISLKCEGIKIGIGYNKEELTAANAVLELECIGNLSLTEREDLRELFSDLLKGE